MIGATDDSDTDFQSAYSASPRGSYGSFESNQGHEYADDDGQTVAIESDPTDDFGKHSVPSFSKSRRERVSSASTAIAIIPHDHAEPSPTLSEDTVVSRGHDVSKRG